MGVLRRQFSASRECHSASPIGLHWIIHWSGHVKDFLHTKHLVLSYCMFLSTISQVGCPVWLVHLPHRHTAVHLAPCHKEGYSPLLVSCLHSSSTRGQLSIAGMQPLEIVKSIILHKYLVLLHEVLLPIISDAFSIAGMLEPQNHPGFLGQLHSGLGLREGKVLF